MSGEAHFEIYPEIGHFPGDPLKDCAPTGNYRWRFQAANGEIVAESGQGFGDRRDANRAVHDLLAAIYSAGDPHPPIRDVDR